MRKWVKWCLNNHLSLIVYFAMLICSPLYFIAYFPDAFKDLKLDIISIYNESKRK